MLRLGLSNLERRLEVGTRRLSMTGESADTTTLPHELMFRIPVITADESHLFRPTSSDLLIFTPALAPRPASRLKVDGQIKGLFLSTPQALPEGTTSSRPLQPHSEPAVAVWIGEKKGAPAIVSLYPISTLVGQSAPEAEKTETREMPTTTARKAFYKADKLQVKWNNAGTMVSSAPISIGAWLTPRLCSLPTAMSTAPVNHTTARPIST